MSFKYACFISYRNIEVAKPVARALKVKLDQIMRAYFEEEGLVWLDETRLEEGDLLEQRIGPSLCQSVCMILLYTNTHFSEINPWCAREYFAMRQLEEERLRQIPDDVKLRHRFIIPIAFRGFEDLPDDLSERNPYRFEWINQDVTSHEKFPQYIGEIAQYLYQCVRLVIEQGVTPVRDCVDFRLPNSDQIEEELQPFLTRRIVFPR